MIEFLEEDNEESDIEFDDEEESGEEDNLERQDLDSDTEQRSFGFRKREWPTFIGEDVVTL